MRDQINSQGNVRKDSINDELAEFALYREELLSLVPVNTEEKTVKYQEILKRYLGIDVGKILNRKEG